MSLVDTAKALHRRITERLTGRPIVFIHAPKCGGTSVGRALRRAYMLSQGTVKPRESAMAFDAAQRSDGQVAGDVSDLREMMLLYLLYCDTRCISAHVAFSNAAFDRFSDRYIFVTLLRDPVERFISNYYWSQRRASPSRVDEPIEQFLASDRAIQMGSTYVQYFSGEPWRKEVSPGQIEAAIANIRQLSAVGFLDRIEHFEARLRNLTGARLKIGHENVGKTTPEHGSVLSNSLRDRIRDVCRPDREIWDAVQDLRR